MIITILLVAVVVVVLLAMAGFVFWRRRPQQLKTDYYQAQWLELQALLHNKSKWADAVLAADSLLDTALKKKHIRGRSMGERLVKVQRILSDNDSAWFGHKLRNRIATDPQTKLKESEVKQALLGIRQALKDVGALPNGQSGSSK